MSTKDSITKQSLITQGLTKSSYIGVEVFDPQEFIDYYARLTDKPNDFGRSAILDFFNEGLSSGWYDKADIIRILGLNVEADSLLNIKADEFNATKVLAPTFVPKLGWIGAAGNYLLSGYTFGVNNVNLTFSDACMLVWQNLKPSDKSGKIAGAGTRDDSILHRIAIEPAENDNKLRAVFSGSDSVESDWVANYTYTGGLKGFDYNGTNQRIMRNGIIKKDSVYSPLYFPTRELRELSGEVRSTPAYWLGDYSFLFAGGSLTQSQHTSLSNAVKTLLSKLSVSWTKPTVLKPLYIIAGQSNCGRCQAADIDAGDLKYKGALTGVNIYNPSYYQKSTWNQANIGVNSMLLDDLNLDEFGMEASLGWELQNYKSEDIYIFKHAMGGTSLAEDWSPTDSSNKMWEAFIPNIREMLKNMIIEGFVPDLKAFIWMQGEQDAGVSEQANAYLTNLTAFFNQIDIELAAIYQDLDLTFTPNYKKVIGRIQAAKWGTIVPGFQDDYANIPANNALIIDTDAYTLLPDNIHFDADSQIQFGLDIFNQIKDL